MRMHTCTVQLNYKVLMKWQQSVTREHHASTVFLFQQMCAIIRTSLTIIINHAFFNGHVIFAVLESSGRNVATKGQSKVSQLPPRLKSCRI